MLPIRFKVAVFAAVAVLAAGCTGGQHSSGLPRGTESNDQKLAAAVRQVSAANARGAHGDEVESGVPYLVRDGNRTTVIPPSATVTKAAGGWLVTFASGETRTFAKTAVITLNGEYHRYAVPKK